MGQQRSRHLVEPRTQRPRIADVAREAGVSKTAVSFAFNSPDRLAPDTATPDPRRRRAARLHATSGRPDAHPASDDDDRRPHPAGPVGHLLATRSSGRSARASRSSPRSTGTACTSSRPLHGSLARAMSRATVDGVVAIGLSRRSPGGRADPARGPADRARGLDRPARSTARSRSTTSVAPVRPPSTSSSLGHRDVLVLGVEPPAPASSPIRMASWADACAAIARPSPRSGWSIPDDRLMIGPATIDGGIAILDRAWEDGLRPTAILAMSDVMAIGAMRALRDLRLASPATSASSASTTSISLRTWIPRSRRSISPSVARARRRSACLLTVVERRDLAKPEHRRLETRLIVRGSTGPVPPQREEVAGEQH